MLHLWDAGRESGSTDFRSPNLGFRVADCFPFLPVQIVANIRGPYRTTLPGALCRFWHEATRLRQRATSEPHNPIGSGAKLEDYSDDQ